jgi:TPR repeat protein
MFPKLPIRTLFVAALLLAAAGGADGQTTTNHIFAVRAQKAFDLAQKNYLADTNSATAACDLARTSFDLSDFATNEAQRAEIARHAIEVCRQWLTREPKSAAGHYYLAMNLGELAQAEAPSLVAYRLVHEVEREFATAAELDVHYDYAGPARNLGELYFQAPGWPFSVGSRHKAREWFERAATLAPEFPENQLNLAEAQLKWRQHEALEMTMTNLDAIWPAARTNFTGEAWEQSWLDWNTRRAALKEEVQRLYGVRHGN